MRAERIEKWNVDEWRWKDAYYYNDTILTKRAGVRLPIQTFFDLFHHDNPTAYYLQGDVAYKVIKDDGELWVDIDKPLAELLLDGMSLDEAIGLLLL